jgi:outer membrane protein OmpA-like peptidoglycan-associated protein
LLSVSNAVRAQGLPLDRFDPAPAGDRMFGVPSPFVAGHLVPYAALLLDYAHDPLVLRTADGHALGSVVSSQLFLHANATLALWNRLAINLDVPFALVQAGDSPTVQGQSFPSPGNAQVGDLRGAFRVRILGDYDDVFQLGVGAYVWLPTGPSDAYVGSGSVRGMPQVIVGGRGDRIVWSFAAGPDFRGTQTFAGVTQGSEIHVGAGLGFLLLDNRRLQIGPETYGAFTVVRGDKPNDALQRASNVEVLLDARYRVVDDVEVGLGVGPGLTAGIGTPDFRGVLMAAYTPEMKKPTPGDRDGDGIADDKDACPDVKGVPDADPTKNGCPPDRDGDGIPDADDACPDVKGVADRDPKKNGCPPDRDGDGIVDDKDACPDEPGPPNEDPKKNGCPLPKDTDGDGIPDAQDACPTVKGVPDPDPKKNGCPPDRDHDGIPDGEDACPDQAGPRNPDPKINGCPTVHVTATEIIITEQVQFDTDRATIKPASDPLLDKVAEVFKGHEEIARVEVEGHTDNKGSAVHNKTLSQRRAEAVLQALVKRGIAAKRLVAKGYGQEVPIADNNTEDGRQQNRRVQFKIVDKKPK